MTTTPAQTIGPFLHIGLAWLTVDDLAPGGVDSEKIAVEGRIFDGDAKPVTDAVVEIWQADAHGCYVHQDDRLALSHPSGFQGFGRVFTDDGGGFHFRTIKPGRVADARGAMQAPHLNVAIFMRGLLKHLMTRMYFAGDPANDADAVLASIPGARRATLLARPIAGNNATLEWNVVLQGQRETVFFDC